MFYYSYDFNVYKVIFKTEEGKNLFYRCCTKVFTAKIDRKSFISFTVLVKSIAVLFGAD